MIKTTLLFILLTGFFLSGAGLVEKDRLNPDESDYFSKKELQDDFLQFRRILENEHCCLYEYASKAELSKRFSMFYASLYGFPEKHYVKYRAPGSNISETKVLTPSTLEPVRNYVFANFSSPSLEFRVLKEQDIKIYPALYDSKPEVPSPFKLNDTTETILVITKENKYGVVPVTMENGKPLLYSYKVGTLMGKDQQLALGAADFPPLAKTGLHSEEQLDEKTLITGIPVDVINCTARPNGYSYAGFMAADEDIISVLKGDNGLVRKMGLTHPQLAKPMFHVWNLILKEMELGNWARFYDNIKCIIYNNNVLNFSASGSKGWQISIFFDEVQGRYNIHIDRELTAVENNYLDTEYYHLDNEARALLKKKLTTLDFSEMNPYYIMKYGFYEGHTEYRCDPIAIALIFGLKSLEEIDEAFEGKLFEILTGHFFHHG